MLKSLLHFIDCDYIDLPVLYIFRLKDSLLKNPPPVNHISSLSVNFLGLSILFKLVAAFQV